MPYPDMQQPQIYDEFADRPYVGLILSEFWGMLAAVIVYFIFEIGAFITTKITLQFNTSHSDPATFLGLALSWTASIGATMTFIIITYFQLRILVKRLRRNLADV